MKIPYYSIIFCSLLLSLSACAPFKFNDKRANVCNELNSKIIFSGGTQNTRNAEIANAETPMLQHSYDTKCAK